MAQEATRKSMTLEEKIQNEHNNMNQQIEKDIVDIRNTTPEIKKGMGDQIIGGLLGRPRSSQPILPKEQEISQQNNPVKPEPVASQAKSSPENKKSPEDKAWIHLYYNLIEFKKGEDILSKAAKTANAIFNVMLTPPFVELLSRTEADLLQVACGFYTKLSITNPESFSFIVNMNPEDRANTLKTLTNLCTEVEKNDLILERINACSWVTLFYSTLSEILKKVCDSEKGSDFLKATESILQEGKNPEVEILATNLYNTMVNNKSKIKINKTLPQINLNLTDGSVHIIVDSNYMKTKEGVNLLEDPRFSQLFKPNQTPNLEAVFKTADELKTFLSLLGIRCNVEKLYTELNPSGAKLESNYLNLVNPIIAPTQRLMRFPMFSADWEKDISCFTKTIDIQEFEPSVQKLNKNFKEISVRVNKVKNLEVMVRERRATVTEANRSTFEKIISSFTTESPLKPSCLVEGNPFFGTNAFRDIEKQNCVTLQGTEKKVDQQETPPTIPQITTPLNPPTQTNRPLPLPRSLPTAPVAIPQTNLPVDPSVSNPPQTRPQPLPRTNSQTLPPPIPTPAPVTVNVLQFNQHTSHTTIVNNYNFFMLPQNTSEPLPQLVESPKPASSRPTSFGGTMFPGQDKKPSTVGYVSTMEPSKLMNSLYNVMMGQLALKTGKTLPKIRFDSSDNSIHITIDNKFSKNKEGINLLDKSQFNQTFKSNNQNEILEAVFNTPAELEKFLSNLTVTCNIKNLYADLSKGTFTVESATNVFSC